ncbi:hypothetical protein [Saccharothrix coeruleofusca]|uniref:Uncharacterized protein n=1 Tax=Saccharothrix coeruleofusca TaxID=33919 RepID=A0A918AJC7_9PSEU|nr:hypothetical protein [Saccharothrix coeruleofusca]GGP49587.1 hypothetical protein GCM10010185_22200 [Saccharothrix coeruleofusca]
MSTTVFSQLDRSLHEHLTALVRLAAEADERTAAELTRSALPRVVAAVKSLLDEHQPDEHGRCATCRPRWWRRRRPAPCRAYLGAQLCLMAAPPARRLGRPEVGPSARVSRRSKNVIGVKGIPTDRRDCAG